MATHLSTPRSAMAHRATAAPRGSERPALPTLAAAVAQCAPRYLPATEADFALAFAGRAGAPVEQGTLARPSGLRRRFGELRTALADGWEIVQPIFARPLWSATDNSITAFNFVLHRGSEMRLLTVPDGRTVSRFVRDQCLMVDYRR